MLSQEVNDYEKSTQQYFTEIRDFGSLSKDEERELFLEYNKTHDPEIRNKILDANLKFVVNVAKSYKGRGLSFADLIAEGNIGMMKAIDRFEIDRGYKFISYAVWWIRQTIDDAINKRNNLPAEELPYACEQPCENDDDITVEKQVGNEYIENTNYESQRDKDEKDAISSLSEDLTERERNILNLYFGLDGNKPLTLEEIGKEYDLTKERVRQINEKSLKKMRSQALKKCITSDIYR